MVPSGTVSLTKLALAVQSGPLPVAGAVGGACVMAGVRDGRIEDVGLPGSVVGVGRASSVCPACTVMATEVAMMDSFEAAPQALRMRATVVRNAVKMYVRWTVIPISFRAGQNYTRFEKCQKKGLRDPGRFKRDRRPCLDGGGPESGSCGLLHPAEFGHGQV